MKFRCSGGGLGESRRNVVAIGAWLLATALGCQASQPEDPVSHVSLPIVGGSQAATCEWPSAVMIIGRLVCSGALVHPRAVVTAKHCLMDAEQTRMVRPDGVGFGESRDQWARTVSVSRCYVHPTNDIGLCILAEDVTDVPIVPVMAPCETSELLPGKPIIEVGFGVIGATGRVYGNKKWIDGIIESRSANLAEILVTTGSQDGEYFGDSGGPLFFKMPDQTWRLIGEDCCSDDIDADAGPRISTYFSVPYHLAWMEEQSGLDLTPCHDLAGWNPDVNCTGFPNNPGAGVGTWTTSCQGGPTARLQTCATSPYDAGPRADASEGGRQDAPSRDVRPNDRMPDRSPDVPSPDAPSPDASGAMTDSLDARPDGRDTPPAVEGGNDGAWRDALPPDTNRSGNDTALPSLDAKAREVILAPDSAGVQDGGATWDTTAPDAGQRVSDGRHDGGNLTARPGGCSCRSAGSAPAGRWSLLVSFGLVGIAARGLRRRRPPGAR